MVALVVEMTTVDDMVIIGVGDKNAVNSKRQSQSAAGWMLDRGFQCHLPASPPQALDASQSIVSKVSLLLRTLFLGKLASPCLLVVGSLFQLPPLLMEGRL